MVIIHAPQKRMPSGEYNIIVLAASAKYADTVSRVFEKHDLGRETFYRLCSIEYDIAFGIRARGEFSDLESALRDLESGYVCGQRPEISRYTPKEGLSPLSPQSVRMLVQKGKE
ncbi:hypothetical protein JXC34_01760 [Candidatus Woesearchaeota archaeon]|nr:hypothetical protein [Candidatus Woesearchaeota archaeon]